jgi:transcriptional regulator with XRE-family HTH domain
MGTTGSNLAAVFAAVLSDKLVNRKQLAGQLGVNYRTLSYWIRDERTLPAKVVPRLCAALQNYEILDALEREAGRIAFTVPGQAEVNAIEDIKDVQRLVQAVGGALDSLARALADGVVEDRDLSSTIPELDDVIRECAALKYWLTGRCAADKARIPHPSKRGC